MRKMFLKALIKSYLFNILSLFIKFIYKYEAYGNRKVMNMVTRNYEIIKG